MEPHGPRAVIDRSVLIASGVKTLAQWCLRLLIIAAAGYVLWFILKQLWRGVLPVALALIVCSVLYPPVRWMRDRGMPASLATFLAIIGSFGVFGAIIWLITPIVGRQSQALYYQSIEAVQRFQLWLQGPPFKLDDDKMNERINDAVGWLQNQAGSIAGEIFSGIGIATSVLVTLGVVIVLTFFFLKDGERFLPWLRRFAGQKAGWHLTELLTRSWITLGGFVRAQAIVSLVDAVFIGLGLIILGVPMALALAVLTFLGGFIPIVGAFVAGTLAVVVALVSLGLTKAVIVLAIVIAVQQLEGNILSPLLQSRAMNLHPVIVLVTVTVGGSLFGIVGAFLAVPTAAMIAVFLRYLDDMTALRAGEKTASEIEFATVAGSLSGQYGEEAGRKLRESVAPEPTEEESPEAPKPSTPSTPSTPWRERARGWARKSLSLLRR
nr:AI-2E family transporter [Corynebacterium vitaeruminis]